jgi:hypothetical protein
MQQQRNFVSGFSGRQVVALALVAVLAMASADQWQ